RPARPPADIVGATDPAAGDGRAHQPHHRRPGEDHCPPGVRDRQGLARRDRAGGEAAGLPDNRRPNEGLSHGQGRLMLPWFARDETPVLLGRRVTLRAPRPADYPAWYRLRKESRDFLKPFEPRWTEADLSQGVFAARLR